MDRYFILCSAVDWYDIMTSCLYLWQQNIQRCQKTVTKHCYCQSSYSVIKAIKTCMATLTSLQTIGQADTYIGVVVSVRQAIISAAHDRWGNLWLLMTAALLDHQVMRLPSTMTGKKAATCHHWSKLVFHLHNKSNKKIWVERNPVTVHLHLHAQSIIFLHISLKKTTHLIL